MVALLIHFKICILGKIAEPPLPPLPGNAPPPHRKYALPLITAIIQKSFAPPYIQGGRTLCQGTNYELLDWRTKFNLLQELLKDKIIDIDECIADYLGYGTPAW